MPTFKRRDQEEFEKAKDLLEGAPAAEMGFVKSLFFGRLNLEKVMPYPRQDPEDARRGEELLSNLEMFLKAEVNADEIDKVERIPRSVVDGLGKLGVLGMSVPREFGGGAYSQVAYCRALELVKAKFMRGANHLFSNWVGDARTQSDLHNNSVGTGVSLRRW